MNCIFCHCVVLLTKVNLLLSSKSKSKSKSSLLSPTGPLQLMDLSEVFLSTDIEFLRKALSEPEGSVQAICVPGGAVGGSLLAL